MCVFLLSKLFSMQLWDASKMSRPSYGRLNLVIQEDFLKLVFEPWPKNAHSS